MTRIEFALDKVQNLLKDFSRNPDDTVVVLEARENSVHYYCVSWKLRCIFWPEETEILVTTGHARPIYDRALLGTPPVFVSSRR